MMTSDFKKLLLDLKKGKITVARALEILKTLPFKNLSSIKLDTHRPLRKGVFEIVYGEGKTLDDLRKILAHHRQMKLNCIITRLDEEKATPLLKEFTNSFYYKKARIFAYGNFKKKRELKRKILVITAGTSDIPVAEEAAVFCELLGNNVKRIYDVGVAGIHRVLYYLKELQKARVIIVVAGMEGALPSVVGGLVSKPVIAVPTSVGYGASFAGLSALLTMLNSCAPGVCVVNIDNGFGAGYLAHIINNL